MHTPVQGGWCVLQRVGDQGEVEQEEAEARAAGQQQQAGRQAQTSQQTRAQDAEVQREESRASAGG